MGIHETFVKTMKERKNEIGLVERAIFNSVASLVYSEYLANIKRKQVPTFHLFIPAIKNVKELMAQDGQFFNVLSEKLIDRIAKNGRFIPYKDAPEFVLFNDDNIEIMKTILDLYILPNMEKRIPETIGMKFGLNNVNEPNPQIIEDSTLDLFSRQPINDRQMDYIIEETVLQLLSTIDSMNKDIQYIESNSSFYFQSDDKFALIVANRLAICNVIYNKWVLENESVAGTLNFVSSTAISGAAQDGYMMTTGPSNQCCIEMFKSIEAK